MEFKMVLIGPLIGFITLLGIHCSVVEYKLDEKEIAKAIILSRMVHASDNMFERKAKSLVANFLVNSVISRQSNQITQTESSAYPDEYDYEPFFPDTDKTTTQKIFTWPPIFHNVISTTVAYPVSEAENVPIIQVLSNSFAQPETKVMNSTTMSTSTPMNGTTSSPVLSFPIVEKRPTTIDDDAYRRKPAAFIGAIQYLTLMIPDALRPGKNTTRLLNKQSITSILKIIGSVASLNVSGVVENSMALGENQPIRELVDGITNLVLCNPFVKRMSGGRCQRRLFEDGRFNLNDLMDFKLR